MSDGQTHIHEDGTVHAHEPGAESAHSHHHTNTRAVKNRLARVIGHLHAVERMVQEVELFSPIEHTM